MLICPICQAPLEQNGNGLACANRHSFDRARQSTTTCCRCNTRTAATPATTPPWSRRAILEGGHYAPLAARLATLAAEYAPARWLGIGCGEGYYTEQIARALPHADGYALDISREAVKRACKRAPQLSWLVASMARVPLADAGCQLLANVFSPLDWSGASACLPPAAACCAWVRLACT